MEGICNVAGMFKWARGTHEKEDHLFYLTPESITELRKYLIRKYPYENIEMEIEGHTRKSSI